jgi:hypothetical protein
MVSAASVAIGTTVYIIGGYNGQDYSEMIKLSLINTMQYCNNTYSSGGVLSLEKQEVMFFSSVTGTTMTLQPEEFLHVTSFIR